MIMNSSVYGCSADSTEIQRIVQYGIYPSKDAGIATRGERRCLLAVPAIFYPSCFFFLDREKVLRFSDLLYDKQKCQTPFSQKTNTGFMPIY